jgi:hypothetical protein|tara:strand:- start:1093 stop:1704 length:612 start_codon:yes stop_codon:yes gene_type:complete
MGLFDKFKTALTQMKIQKVEKIRNPNGSGNICSYCREPMNWYQTTCGQCGKVLGQKYVGCPDCGRGYPPGTTTCPRCDIGEGGYSPLTIVHPHMKYYKFLTYFAFPIGVLYHFFLLYNYNRIQLPVPLILFSILIFIILIYGLHNKIRWSWKLLIYWHGLTPVFAPFMPGDGDYLVIGILVHYATVLWPTYIYFKKRKHLFFK